MSERIICTKGNGTYDFIWVDDHTIEIDYWWPGLVLPNTNEGTVFKFLGNSYRIIEDKYPYRRVRAVVHSG